MKTPKPKTERLEIRLSTAELNRIRMLAKLYAGGNTSKWVVYAAIEAERKVLK